MQLQFTDEEAVYRFYKTYAMMHGFAVRLDEVRRNSDGCVIMRQIVCNRAGSRKEEVEKDERIRDHRPLTRSCCRARIRARLDRKIHKWKVVSFYEEHSHGLVDPLDVSMMPEYRTFILVTSLSTLEDFAAKTFTRNMFREVRKEIEGACAMNTELVIQDGGKLYFKCNSFGVLEIDHVVEFDIVGGMLRCECLWFENRGIPYMHIFACLKHQHVEVILERLVCKHWTKNVKSDFMKSNVDDPSDSDKVLKCRLGVLGAECSRLMDVESKNSSDFVEVMNDVVNTITRLQKQGENPRNGNLDDDYVVDPLVVKSKGAPKKNSKFKQRRRCSNCGVTAHYNKCCPNVLGRIPKEPVDDDTEKISAAILTSSLSAKDMTV
ncbi:hypothetical protein S83_039627 [Arachis hypogaea]